MPTSYDLSPEALRTYRSAVIRPDDFDAFWAATLAEARQQPVEARFTPLDYGLTLIDVFDISFAGFGGHTIRGWLLLPHDTGEKLPVVVRYIGYGGGRGLPHEHLLWPAAGYAHLVMDTRGQGSGWTPGDTSDPVGSDPAHPGFMTRGIASRETYYYRRVFTDGVRAIDAARAHPSIDADRIAVIGGSQGGGIALAVAALEPAVKAVMADVPFLSDFPRAVRIASRDPYQEISRYLSIHRDKVSSVFNTLRYFDCTCFAPRITVPALVSVAMMDTVCPPSSVYAAFNALGSPDKTLIDYGFNDHEGGGVFQQREQIAWLVSRKLG